ncbi:hypothetical protein Kpol_463p12 [Vanderwaltozyma polyspora DSM 70294]|uniref:Glutamate--cysteine ligase n=1 Tax=Vanderwaltozyma polyspora (strain ATCC 22028 / DSM 70294 / BCRC 21397 / CBS 2163 / NBRC 10782 / NRRL Y-8283 / UCD 57-17) TaxID=436907 RepID=A7TQJ8_VANPO|nr:uncharacterized protein Kpol_463p12 [Vanderwaltozyma polyspora DSM 70294]EDO15462.1 hypothetical protein Kpol_463p12 [Vanderwaltozyma polyspora DSM 70294]
MGLLALGTPLSWDDSKKYNDFIRINGIKHLLSVFHNCSNRTNDPLLWGDEVEYMIVKFNYSDKTAKLDISNDNILNLLNDEKNYLNDCNERNIHFHPEYGRFMLEATPLSPYFNYNGDNYIEFNMIQRRILADNILKDLNADDVKTQSHKLVTITSFPRLGSKNFTTVDDSQLWNHKNNYSRSLFLPDEIINRHIRFPTLTANIRSRRGEKVAINIPMYQDLKTPKMDDTIDFNRNWFQNEDKEAEFASMEKFIYMDSMGFGMGCSCLQLTFQAPSLPMSRYLYDSLINLCPVMLSVSSAAPFFKGWLADQDVRWNVISGSTDDRAPYERNVPSLLKNSNQYGGIDPKEFENTKHLPKARYSTVDLFLGGNDFFNRSYNDTNVPLNDTILEQLLENDTYPMDYDMAKHFAHLFIRDPLVIFEENLTFDENKDFDVLQNHFENIQSTNWQTLRFKPPTDRFSTDSSSPGWRVEFRPLEVQLSDFENAAYSVFIYLLAESILKSSNKLNPYIQMSKVWENMDLAHKRDSTSTEKFHWKDSFEDSISTTSSLYSIDEIFHNKDNGIFNVYINPILIKKGFVESDWKELKYSEDKQRLYYYLKLISDRSSGKIPTTARYMRDFVLRHPDYKQDSKISELINYDLLMMCDRIASLDDSNGELSSYFGTELVDYLQNNKIVV